MRLRHPAIRRDKPQPLLWALTVAVVILAASVISGGLYLNARRVTADQRESETRHAICTVLNALPPGSRATPLRERRAFRAAYRIERCKPLPAPKPTPSASAHPPRSTPASAPPPAAPTVPRSTSTTVVIHPRPHPAITRTKTAKPTPTRTPSPTPEPTTSCLLGIKTILTCTK